MGERDEKKMTSILESQTVFLNPSPTMGERDEKKMTSILESRTVFLNPSPPPRGRGEGEGGSHCAANVAEK
jgi:hypothetical protein